MKKTTITFFAVLMMLVTSNLVKAQAFPDTWKEFDLSKYGMKFTMMAPASATFEYDSDFEELYINAEDDHFRMMISILEETVSETIAEYKEEVEEGDGIELVGYVHDEENGFLAKESIDGEIDYEVYFGFSQGGKTYFFQTNPLAEELYSGSEGENMFNACKQAAGL